MVKTLLSKEGEPCVLYDFLDKKEINEAKIN